MDIGGVLVHGLSSDYLPAAARAFETTPGALLPELEKHVKSLETGRIDSVRVWGKIGDRLARKGVGCRLDDARCQTLWEELLDGLVRLDPQVMNLCRTLRREQELLLGALSNVVPEHVAILEACGAYEPFQLRVLSCEEQTRKPGGKIYRRAAERAQVETRECLFVDDCPENVKGAVRAGMVGHVYRNFEGLEAFLREHGLA